MDVQGTTLNQPFDGDGMVLRFTFLDGRVTFRNRFVETEGLRAERRAGKMLFKGAFATGRTVPGLFNPFDFSVKNVANTHVVQHGGRLWALWEGGLPHELDPASLATLGGGTSNWDGAISGKGPFAAHYKQVPDDEGAPRLVNFGSAIAGDDANVTFYEFDDQAALVRKSGVTLPKASFAFFHDFVVTPNFYVLFANPVSLSMRKLLGEYIWGNAAIAECLIYDPQGAMRVFVVSRGRGPPTVKTFVLDPHFVFHHVNAFERDGELVVDSIAWRSVDFSSNLKTLSPAYYGGAGAHAAGDQRTELYRTTLGLASGEARRTRLISRVLEFPAVAPSHAGRPHQYAYACGAAVDDPHHWGPAQTIVKLSGASPGAPLEEAAVWAPGPRCFTQEPVFVSRPGATAEDHGWLLAMVYDAGQRCTKLCILDATSMTLLAALRLRHIVPLGLHGSFSAA